MKSRRLQGAECASRRAEHVTPLRRVDLCRFACLSGGPAARIAIAGQRRPVVAPKVPADLTCKSKALARNRMYRTPGCRGQGLKIQRKQLKTRAVFQCRADLLPQCCRRRPSAWPCPRRPFSFRVCKMGADAPRGPPQRPVGVDSPLARGLRPSDGPAPWRFATALSLKARCV
jgi:hypothetical protein